MEYCRFKNIFLGFGVGELELHFISTMEDAFIGAFDPAQVDKFDFFVSYKGKNYRYKTAQELLDATIFGNKTLEDVWNDVSLDCIDGFDEDAYLKHIADDYYLCEYMARFCLGERVDIDRLVARLIREEYWGKLILYAGTHELTEFQSADEKYRYYFYIPQSHRTFLLEKDGQGISLSTISFYDLKREQKDCYGRAGRKFDRFSISSSKNKSEKYGAVLQYEKENHKRLPQYFSAILGFVSFIVCVVLCTAKQLWPIVGVGQFVVVLGGIITMSVIRTKRIDRLYERAFSRNDRKAVQYSPMFLEIIKESDLAFESLYEGLYGVDTKVKKYGGFLECGEIDLCFRNKKHEIRIAFYNMCAIITVDEESTDKKYKLSYDKYHNYEELEKDLYFLLLDELRR